MEKVSPRFRVPLMALVLVALLAALWGGLLRLGWRWAVLRPSLPVQHGPLMVSGFLGTLIALERAVALGRRWPYAVPLASGMGAVWLAVEGQSQVGPALLTLGSVGLVAIFVLIVRRQPALFTAMMGAGAVLWLVGNLVWLAGQPVYQVVLWWVGFLVLTIVGERLELARLRRPSRRSVGVLLGLVGFFVAGLVGSLLDLGAGTRVVGVASVLLAFWLLRNDIARHTIRQEGLPRYVGICLLSGYVWLGVGGLLALRFGALYAGPRYDAMLHSLLIGFVFAMILGHAPIIFPAVLNTPLSFRPVFYVHLVLLHVSLLLRLVGDLMAQWTARRWGGLLNAVVILLFLGTLVQSAWRARHAPDATR